MTTTKISLVIGALQFMGLIVTPFYVSILPKLGRKNAVLIGLGVLLVSNTTMGLLSKVSPTRPDLFFYISVISRLVQGAGDSLIMTALYSIIAS